MRRVHACASTLLYFWSAPATRRRRAFGELPFRTVPTAAVCVRATGVPGELVRWSKGGFSHAGARRRPARRRAGDARDDPGLPRGGGGSDDRSRRHRGHDGGCVPGRPCATRPECGGAPATIRTPGFPDHSVAVSAGGDAAVAWLEADERLRPHPRAGRPFARLATRDADAVPAELDFSSAVEVGISAAGETTVLFVEGISDDRARVKVATARARRPFGAARTLRDDRVRRGTALAVAPDGRALVTVRGFNGLNVYERAPGGDFAAPQRVFDGSVDSPRLLLRPGGDGADRRSTRGSTIRCACSLAPALGRSARSRSWPKPRSRAAPSTLPASAPSIPDEVPYDVAGEWRAALGPDGRALVTYPNRERASASPACRPSSRRSSASPLRTPVGVTPLVLPDGTRAIAWSDNKGQLLGGRSTGACTTRSRARPRRPSRRAGGHRRRAGAARAAARAAARPARALQRGLRRPRAPPGRRGRQRRDGHAHRRGHAAAALPGERRGGRARRRPPAACDDRLRRAGHPPPRTTIARVQLRRLPAPPLPHILNLRARRIGNDVEVRWDADVRLRDARYSSMAPAPASRSATTSAVFGAPRQTGRHLRVRLEDAARVRYVTVFVGDLLGNRQRTRTVRVG